MSTSMVLKGKKNKIEKDEEYLKCTPKVEP